MEIPEIPAGVAALIGSLIGSSVSVLLMLVQKRTEMKKELTKIAYEMAKCDFDFRKSNAKPGDHIYPIEIYYHYHYKMLSSINKHGNLTDKIDKLRKEQIEFQQQYDKPNV